MNTREDRFDTSAILLECGLHRDFRECSLCRLSSVECALVRRSFASSNREAVLEDVFFRLLNSRKWPAPVFPSREQPAAQRRPYGPTQLRPRAPQAAFLRTKETDDEKSPSFVRRLSVAASLSFSRDSAPLRSEHPIPQNPELLQVSFVARPPAFSASRVRDKVAEPCSMVERSRSAASRENSARGYPNPRNRAEISSSLAIENP